MPVAGGAKEAGAGERTSSGQLPPPTWLGWKRGNSSLRGGCPQGQGVKLTNRGRVAGGGDTAADFPLGFEWEGFIRSAVLYPKF